jgi:Flp pilus assembly pilin Flp
MSTLITTLQDAYRNACIDAYFGGKTLVERSHEERGQTAAEYVGIILLVSVIIVAVVQSQADDKLKTGLENLIQKILDTTG